MSHALTQIFSSHLLKQALTHFCIVFALSLTATATHAAGLLTPTGSNLPSLEIKEHHVNVVIEDGYAVTSVEQVFYNPNRMDLEAVYSFPIPAKAAVGEFTYWIDGQPVTGEVLEKNKARKIYNEEKAAGREAAITEQDSFKTFDISVSPVRANQEVRIKLTYLQPAHVDTGIGRYVYPLEDGGVDEDKIAFWAADDTVKEKFSFNLRFRSSYPVSQFRLPQHPNATTHQVDANTWEVSLINQQHISTLETDEENTETQTTPNANSVQTLGKDIVVYWRHQADLPGRVDVITHKTPGKDKGTFMLTITPGDDLAKITEGTDWNFVLDYSGSMAGKYHSMVEGVSKGLHKLNPNDRFRLFIFHDNSQELTRGYQTATVENVTQAIKDLERINVSGGTNLYEGLKMGITNLDADRSSAVILVTDGVANIGKTHKKDFWALLEKNDVRLFTFVMGNSADRPLLEGMAKISNGFAVNISNSDDIVGKILEATSKLTHQALHDVNIHISGIKVKALTPEKIGSLYRGQQLIVFGHYWGEGAAKVSINGKISGENKTYTTTFDFPKSTNLYPELERLWAFAAIEDLQNTMDYLGQNADTEQAITDLAVEYGLVTNYTAMIVIRDEEFAKRGIERNNKKRVANEQHARAQRQAEPVRHNRVDNSQPMYNNPAPRYSGGGGGAFGPWGVLFGLILMGIKIRKRTAYITEAEKKNTSS